MSARIAIIGDVHGESDVMNRLVETVTPRSDRLVFVGDYVNRGPGSFEVIQRLVELARSHTPCTFIRGNHDQAFLDFLHGGPLAPLLAMGGAATVKSYLKGSPTQHDLAREFRMSVPEDHIQFLTSLEPHFREDGLLVTHDKSVPDEFQGCNYYHVYGHIPHDQPQVQATYAAIDTGCGTVQSGKLSCLLWPQKDIVQVVVSA